MKAPVVIIELLHQRFALMRRPGDIAFASYKLLI